MTAITFYVQIVKALDEIGAPYMIVGAFGGTIYGITRATHDIDIIVDLQEKDFEALSQTVWPNYLNPDFPCLWPA